MLRRGGGTCETLERLRRRFALVVWREGEGAREGLVIDMRDAAALRAGRVPGRQYAGVCVNSCFERGIDMGIYRVLLRVSVLGPSLGT
jgi:hypothetical protein